MGAMERRYETYLETLNEEILRLRSELAASKFDCQRLSTQLEKQNAEHSIQLQNIQAHHEKKIAKLKSDLEELYYKPKLQQLAQMYRKQWSENEKTHQLKIEEIRSSFIENERSQSTGLEQLNSTETPRSTSFLELK